MHWVIHASVFSRLNLTRLTTVLDRADLPYTLVIIDHEGVPVPEVNPSGSVYVCGAWRAAGLAEQRGWEPCTFLNENFAVDVWLTEIADELLNDTARNGTVGSIKFQTPMFVRPCADTKRFDGQVFTPDSFETWKVENANLADVEVSVSPPKNILREYRLFVVKERVVTGSLYRQAGEVVLSGDVDPEVIDYVEAVIQLWSPADAFVVDVALTDEGCRVIEFNNINSSGFYESDIERYVDAIERAFG